MTTQTELFPRTSEPLPPFARHSETSRLAAIKKYNRHNSHRDREKIYDFLVARGVYGATREEIERNVHLRSTNSYRPRIKELLGEMKGHTEVRLKRNGATRKTKCGNNAEVLVAVNQ